MKSLCLLDRRLGEAHSYQDLLSIMVECFREAGFTTFLYAFQVPERYKHPPSIVYSTFSPEWVSHYMQCNYLLVDPIPVYSAANPQPLLWSVDDDWSAHGSEVVAFMDDVKAWGFRGGVVLPFHLAQLIRGFCNLILEKDFDNLVDRVASVFLLLPYFHHHTRRIYMAMNVDSSLHVRLTVREKQVYEQIADGLTSQEIADRLFLSRRTVEGHTTAVQNKLQAENRVQALCKAVSLGLITPAKVYKTQEPITYVFAPESKYAPA